jgi:hypothetical protein
MMKILKNKKTSAMKKLSKCLFVLGFVMTLMFHVQGQNKALELSVNGVTTSGNGPSTAPQAATFEFDNSNYTATTVPNFETNTPPVSVTISLQNQVYTGLSYGSCNTGLSFGTQKSEWDDPVITTQSPTPGPLYALLGANVGTRGPDENVFKTKPSALINTIDPTGNQFGAEGNWGFPIFTTVEPLEDNGSPKDGRYLYGELVITFSRPVKNPVLHLASLGGSSWYLPSGATDIPANWRMSYFTTELEMVTTGFTSERLAGTPFFEVAGNNILNNATRPNGDSQAGLFDKKGNSAFGAATGSVQVTGTVTQLVYRVYLRGATGNTSDFNFSFDRGVTTSTPGRDPFYGDYWAISFSLDKPTQQISGNIFNDRDGLNDLPVGDINKSAGIDNLKTNVGGLLYANLLNSSGNTVVATVPVGANGAYLFDSVATGSYRVQLTTNQGVVGQPTPVTALPTGWVNTGEFGSNNPGNIPGNDLNVNGISTNIPVNSNDFKVEVNFGIERTPVSVPFSYIIPKPDGGITLTLFGGVNNFAPLTGSDPEDQPATGTLSGKTVQITELPAAFSILRYNGINVVAGQIIPNYNPSLLQIAFTGSTPVSFAEFKYSYLDAAGKPSVPTIYRLEWFGGPLAITITNFSAVKNNCTADLTWTTASEINASRFEIEVSTSNSAVYNKVGSVNASAANGSGKTYQFNYAMQPGVQYYFRLKLMDKDGSFKYSDVRTLSCEGKGVITIAPNPVIDRFSIAGMESGKNTVVIYSANGQQVKTQIIPQAQGYVYIQNLAAGMYSVKVISEKGNITVGKIIKK